MSEIEWEEFIKEIVDKGNKINLRKVCEERGVGLNTLYRKVMALEKTDEELHSKFMSLHPYKPRDTKGIDFEQLMRESIITGISQRELGAKYDISYRTVQRNFAKIRENNPELHDIYEQYLDSGGKLDYNTMEKVEAEYIPQRKATEEQTLQEVRKDFLARLNTINKKEEKQLYKHYEEQVARVEQHINELRENQNDGREEQ